MSVTIPPAMNYQSPLITVPDNTFSEPREGRKLVNCLINWTVDDGGLGAMSINLQNNATLEFSQICGLVVDNSNCGTDLEFVYPDTNVTIGIPAYAPYTIVPVFSHQTQFYVVCQETPLVVDQTRFSILNYAPPPVAVPVTQHQNIASVASIALTGAGSTTVIPNTQYGTVEGINVVVALNKPSVAFNDALALRDGAGNNLWQGNIAADTTSPGGAYELVGLNGLGLRFKQGVQLVQFGGFTPGGTVDVNVYYRNP